MVASYLVLGERGAAEEAIERARKALRRHPGDASMEGRLKYEEGMCKEEAGDEARRQDGDDAAAPLFEEAKEFYRASYKLWKDQATKNSFNRVAAKAHPDMEFVQVGPRGGGYARALKTGVQLEQLV